MYTALQKSLVIIPKITGLMSVFGSIAIIRDLLKGPRAERKKITSKVLIAMNICDLLCTSIAHVIGTWFVPKGTGFWSAGNEHTCDIQGWAQVLFYPYALVYNAVLSIIFLLIVCYSWSEEDFRKWSYFILCAPPVLVTLLVIPLMRYYKYVNYDGDWNCWFTPSPPLCAATPDMECNEDNLDIYKYFQLINGCILPFSTSIIIIYACVRLFLVARQSDESVSAYRSRAQGHYATSNRVAVSGLLYSGGNLLAVLPLIIWFIGLLADVKGAVFWTFVQFLTAIFLPLQGFLNALVYFRPKYLKYKKEKRKENLEYKKAHKEAKTKEKTKEIITNMLEIPGI